MVFHFFTRKILAIGFVVCLLLLHEFHHLAFTSTNIFAGATIYPNFKAWALGKPHERFLSPPSEESEVMGRFKGVFDKVKTGGLEAVQKRFEAGRRLAGSSGDDDGKTEKDNNSAFAFYGGVMMPKRRAALCARKPRNN